MKKILFIVNPKAGRRKAKVFRAKALRFLESNKYTYKIVATAYPGHGIVLARKATEEGFDIVVAVGGDGSVNEILQGLYGSRVTLAIVPMGSGNGIARSLNIPLNTYGALTLIKRGERCKIDVGAVNNRLFLGTAGVGFDALVTSLFSKSSRRGFLTYMKVILSNLRTYKPREWTVQSNHGKSEKIKAFMITVANAPQLGYHFYLAPKAKMGDGNLALIKVRKTSFAGLVEIGIRAFTRTLREGDKVQWESVKTVKIKRVGEFFMQVDGEAIKESYSITLKVMPEQIEVITG